MKLRMPCPCSGIICDVEITPVITQFFLSPVYGIPCYEIVDEIDTHGNITQTPEHCYAVILTIFMHLQQNLDQINAVLYVVFSYRQQEHLCTYK